jgi:hypothetical protein
MLAIQIKLGDLELDSDEHEIYRDSLYELARAEPVSVEQQLAAASQVLDTIDEKLIKIQDSV